MVEHIHLATLVLLAKRLKHPSHGLHEVPRHAIPAAIWVLVPHGVIIGIDLELGGCDNPMRCRIGGIHRIDLSGIRRVIELHVHGHDAVAAKSIEIGPVIGT